MAETLQPAQGIRVKQNKTYVFDPNYIDAQVGKSEEWATKTDGKVKESDVEIDYSSKAYAVGGTGTETNNAKYYASVASAAASDSNVVAVGTDLQDANSKIKGVYNNKTNIDAVAGNKTNIDAVAGNETNINAVNANKTNIDAVVADLTNIDAVAADLTNIDAASTYANNANTWAEGSDADVAALGGTHSAKEWALQEANNYSVTSTGSTTARTLKDRFADVINVKDFGANGDGTTDDCSSIQAALNKAGNIYIPDGTYKVGDKLDLLSNTNLMLSPKAKLLFTGTYGNHAGIHAEGSVGETWYHLTSDVGRGAKEIALDSVSGLSVGDTVLIADDRSSGTDIVDGQTVSVRPKSGEMHKIAKISGSSIFFEDTLFAQDYTTARNAFVKKLNMLENITISGGELCGLDVDASGGHFQNRGIHLYCVNKFFISNVYIQKFRLEGILNEFCNYGIIDGCSFRHIFDEDLGYSIMNAGSQNITTRSCSATICGKLWDTGGGSWVENNVTYDYGWTRFVTCRDSTITSCTRAAIGTHEPTDHVLIDNNSVSIDKTIEYSGIFVRNCNAQITNNSVVYCGRTGTNAFTAGIKVYTKGQNGNVVVSGNKVIDTTDSNIIVYICENWYKLDTPTSDISTYKPTRVIIENNYIESSSSYTDMQANSIYVCGCRDDGDGSVSIKGNSIRMTTNRKAGIFISGKLTDVSITDNIVYAKRPIYILGDNSAKTTVIKNLTIYGNTLTPLNGSGIEIVPSASPDYSATVNMGAIYGNLIYTTYNSLGTFITNVPDDFVWYNSYVYPNETKGTVGRLNAPIHGTRHEAIISATDSVTYTTPCDCWVLATQNETHTFSSITMNGYQIALSSSAVGVRFGFQIYVPKGTVFATNSTDDVTIFAYY